MNQTIADVVENHRVATGAAAIHVDLGPEATPEGVAAELAKVHARMEAYGAFREEERLQARIDRQEELLQQINRLAAAGDMDMVIQLTDMTVDVDLEPDLERMAQRRRKAGEALPEGVEAVLATLAA